MASPQKENGNIQIATEIWEHLTRTRIPGEARQVLDHILRKTYGWNKKSDKISLSQFEEGTGLKKNTICKVLLKLQGMNLITITHLGNEIAKEYGFIKDYDKWKPLPKRGIFPKRVTDITQKGNTSLPIRGTTINTYTKDTITKNKGEAPVDRRNPDIEILIKHGYTLGFSTTKQVLNRYAIHRLLKGKTLEQLKKAADFSQQIREEAYAPQVNNWMDLEEKYLKLRDFVKRATKPQETKHLKL